MSLTSHLENKSSPVRQFIHQSAPRLVQAGTRGLKGEESASSFRFEQLTELEVQLPVPGSVKNRKSHAIVAGMALDYRIRMDLPGFDLERTVARKGLDCLAAEPGVVHKGKHIVNLLQDAFAFAHLTLKEQGSHPLSLARVSVPLAWCESIVRAGPHDALSGDLGRLIKRARDATELMMGIDESLLFDIAVMRDAVEPLVEDWSKAIAAGCNYTPNPHLLGSAAVGGADADWAVDDILVDLKTKETITNPWIRETLLQLLGYTLLDLDDSLGIRKVGILLPRQPYFAVWTLDELLDAEAVAALPELREGMAVVLSEM